MKLNNGVLFLIGIAVAFAYDNLSRKKYASQSTTHVGFYDLYKADNAVDGDTATCMRTTGIGGTSPNKTVWWKVDLGGVYNIYSVNIKFKNYEGEDYRQQGRFAGFSIYVSATGVMDNSSLCYKDGPNLPPLNFTTKCLTSGRYMVYYNERLPGVAYPNDYQLASVFIELCEVNVLGCRNSGVYGSNCDMSCPINCRYNTCHIQNGNCFWCKHGWNGTKCDKECVAGRYGQDCKEQCLGHCRDNTVCYHVTGQCDKGCAAGWMGNLCDKECKDGTYGNNCVHICSGNCLNDSPCNKETGHCDEGCEPGYTNALCNEHCLPGHYGKSCDYDCSGHCSNNDHCDPIHGTCLNGCNDGYIGKHCNISCKNGHYEPNCTRACSSNCKTCNSTDGKCSCYPGWMGLNCSIACSKSFGENCKNPCSPFCINETCDPFNGTCLTTCENETYGEKCRTEFRVGPDETLTPVIVAGTLSTCIILLIIGAIFLKRKNSSSKSCEKGSPYVDLEVLQGGYSTYQELTVSRLDNTYQNLSLQ